MKDRFSLTLQALGQGSVEENSGDEEGSPVMMLTRTKGENEDDDDYVE